LLRNLVTSLIIEERIETTVTKAKAMKPHVEKMITLGKKGGVANRRLAAAYLLTPQAVDKLFNTGGYTRIILTGFRKGDGGEKALIEILGSEKVVDEKREKRSELRAKRAEETRKAMEAQQEPPAAEGGEEPKA
jgi:large subunit ribosomal protein L17